jgi:K+-transporting ATPase KdpF subunit
VYVTCWLTETVAMLSRFPDDIERAIQASLVAPDRKGFEMSVDNLVGGLVALGLLAYLLYALVRPEKF